MHAILHLLKDSALVVGLYVVLTELLTLTYLNKGLKGVFLQSKHFKLKIRDVLTSLLSGCTVEPGGVGGGTFVVTCTTLFFPSYLELVWMLSCF